MEPIRLLALHPRQILGDSLPLLFPAFRGFPLSPPRASASSVTREILVAKGGTVGEKDVR